LRVDFSRPWKIVERYRHTAHRPGPRPSCDAASPGKSDHVVSLAERAGFEPARRFKPPTAFPVLLLRPLGHLSKQLLIVMLRCVAVHDTLDQRGVLIEHRYQ